MSTSSNTEKQVADLLEAIESGAAEPVAVINPNRYIQHNLGAADGLAGFGALQAMAAQGVTMKYDVIHKVLGEGNFVLVVSEGALGGRPTSFYDLFRVENGKVAEHWDTIETVPPREQWKNNNGKFGF